MVLKQLSFFISRKHNRLKIMKLYSTCCQISEAHYSSVVPINVAIAQHAKKGELDVARYLFDRMPMRTVVSWNTMISGYSKCGRYLDALDLVSTMHHDNVRLNESTFSSILSACAHSQSLCDGKQLHCLLLKYRLESFEFVGSALLYFYANCLQIEEAKRIFQDLRDKNELLWSLMLVGYVQCNLMNDALDVFMKMPIRDVVAWTTLISGYAKSDDGCKKALVLFRWMMGSTDVVPNEYTLDCVIRACARLGVVDEGRVAHGMSIKLGYESEYSTSNALIEFYSNCGAIDDARKIYDVMVNPGLSSSNSLIGGFILMGRVDDAELIFNRLSHMNPESCNLMIKGYSMCGRIEDSKRLFEKMPSRTIVSSNTMISVYSRNGEIDKALELFEKIKEKRNPVTWNSMISGYIQSDRFDEALRLYVTMCRSSIDKTRSTFSVLFHACACLGSLRQGKSLHSHLIKTPFESNAYVGTSLIDMYSKCGSITSAYKSFSYIASPNVAAWTALITGYGHHGLGHKAILTFACMLDQGVEPNAATFVGILTACSRSGLVNEGISIFYSMKKYYGVTPTLEHYACVVDLLGRSGQLREAEEFIKAMPIEADMVVWGALLSACWFWRNTEVGQRVAEKMISLDPKQLSSYVILSNLYAVLGKWRMKMNVRNRLKDLEAKKDPGCSWIELNGKYHVFSVEDRSHPSCNVIYATLDQLVSNLNCAAQLDGVYLTTVGNNNAIYNH